MAEAMTAPAAGGGVATAPEAISDAASGGGYAPAAVLPTRPVPQPLPGGDILSPRPSGASVSTSPNSITGVRSFSQLQAAAQQQVNDEIASQEAPLNAQMNNLQGREVNAQGALTQMYGSLMPYVAGESAFVAQNEQQAEGAQQAIFSAANAQMNSLLQSRAQQAQALAQEMGGPVAIGDFNGNLGSYAEALANTGASDQLHALGMGEAGVQESADFAGKVFPLTQVEHSQEISNYFQGEEQKIRDQIQQLEGSKSGKATDQLNTLLQQERQYALDKHQQAMDAKKNAQDWAIQQHTLKNDDARLTLAQNEFNQSKTAQNQTLALRASQISNQAIEAANRIGMSEAQLRAKITQQTTSNAIAQQRLKISQQRNAISMVDAMTKSTKPVTMTQHVILDPTAAQIAIAKGSTNVYRDAKTNQYYTLKSETMMPAQWMQQQGIDPSTPVGNLNSIYQAMVSAGIPKVVARGTIRKRYGKPSWTPGK